MASFTGNPFVIGAEVYVEFPTGSFLGTITKVNFYGTYDITIDKLGLIKGVFTHRMTIVRQKNYVRRGKNIFVQNHLKLHKLKHYKDDTNIFCYIPSTFRHPTTEELQSYFVKRCRFNYILEEEENVSYINE